MFGCEVEVCKCVQFHEEGCHRFLYVLMLGVLGVFLLLQEKYEKSSKLDNNSHPVNQEVGGNLYRGKIR